MNNLIKCLSLIMMLLTLCQWSTAQDAPREMLNIQGNALIAGDPTINPALGGNANGIIRFGWPTYPGCMGHYGRFCRLTNGIPDGRYDLIQYLNADFDGERFKQIDPNYDVWVGGICIAPDPERTGYEIAYAPAGNAGEIQPISRLKIDGKGQVGICTSKPLATLDVQNEDTQTASIRLGFTPNGISSCRRIWCPGNRDYVWDYTNAEFDIESGRWFAPNPDFGSFRRQVCTGPGGINFNMGPAVLGSANLEWIPSLSINELGTVGINTEQPNPEVQLDVNGVIAAFDFVQLSDRRYKKNIAPIKNSLNKVSQLNAVQYQFKTNEFKEKAFDDGTQVGFIAQEVQHIYPEIVNEDKEGYLSISYTSLIPVLADAIKELQRLNNEMHRENTSLQNQLAQLQTEVTKINKVMLKLKNKNEFGNARVSQQ